MKRYLKTITAVVLAALTTAACQKENFGDATPAGQEVDVTLDLLAPQIGTKSYGDGTTAKTVYVHVYQQDTHGNLTYIEPAKDASLKTPSQSLTLNDLKATYSTRLVTGQTYTFVFWAQADKAPYTYDTDAKTITVNYASAKGNDESRDAFYNVLPNVKIEGAYTASVQLSRPFAQLNFGVTSEDYAAAKAAGLTVTDATVTLTHAATSLNLLDGKTTGDETVTFAKAALPADPNAVLTAGGKDYKYVAMDYVLVGKSAKTLSDVTLTLTATGTHSATPKFTYTNVPLQANYRTNIVGNLFTSPAEVQIEITPGFGTPDNDIVIENVSSIAAANTAFANGATAVNVTNILSGENTDIVLPKTTNGVSLTLPAVPTGKTVTIKYADGASEGQKPQTLTVNAKSADAIVIEAPTTHVELNGVTVTTVTASTSSTTLVVGKDVKIENLNILKGAVEIYGTVGTLSLAEGCSIKVWSVGTKDEFNRAMTEGAQTIELNNDIKDFSEIIFIDRSLSINGNGHEICNTANRVIRVREPNLNVSFYDLVLTSKSTATNDTRCVSFDNTSSDCKVLFDNCKLSAGYYCINLTQTSNVTLTIRNATVAAGWAAINSYANSSEFIIENSVLRGLNDKSESTWNNFATIVFDGDGLNSGANAGEHGTGNKMTIKNSTVFACSENSNRQSWLAMQYGANDNTVEVENTIIRDANGNNQDFNWVVDNEIKQNGKFVSYESTNKVYIDGVLQVQGN